MQDTVLALKLLNNAGLSQYEKQLALTACNKLEFELMKSALKRIFGNSSNTDYQEVCFNRRKFNDEDKN